MRNNSPSKYSAIGTKTTDTIKTVSSAFTGIPGRPARLFSFSITNNNASVRYLQFFDSTGATTTISAEHVIPAGGECVLSEGDFTLDGLQFFSGITWGVSTTSGSYTAATATDHKVFALYA